MVNSGGPSRACGTCKKRKVKCDEARPICGRCIKSKRVCLGYRSETDLLFRDQTEHTVTRMSQAQQYGITSAQFPHATTQASCSSFADPRIPGSEESASPRLTDLTVPVCLSSSIQEIANAYFFRHFVVWKSERHSFCFYQILENAYRRTDAGSTLSVTTEALATMTLAKSPGNSSRRSDAAKSYARAVRSVGNAVADEARARENETLLSVILLSFAETIDAMITKHPSVRPRLSSAVSDADPPKFHLTTAGHSWGAHASGAYMILRMRGWKDVRSSQESMLLAAFVCVQNLVKAIYTAEPLDASWAPLEELKGRTGPYNTNADLSTVGLQIPRLRWRGSQLLRRPMCAGLSQELFALLADVRAVDLDLCAWITIGRPRLATFLAGYVHGPIGSDPMLEPAWPGAIYHHDNIQGIHAYNIFRAYRLFLHLLMFNILERLISPDLLQTHPEFVACQDTLQALVDEICGTVPCCLEYLDELHLSSSPVRSTSVVPAATAGVFEVTTEFSEAAWSTASSETVTSRESSPNLGRVFKEKKGPVIAAWYLTWPLYIAYNVLTISNDQRAWLRGRLRYIGEVFGIDQALEYQMGESIRYFPGIPRPLTNFDYAPPAWEPLQ